MSSLTAYRRQASLAGGRYVLVTADASGGTTTTLVCAGLKTNSAATELYTDWWVYAPAASAADKIRQVSLFAPSTGTVTVDRAVSGASVYNSKVIELHGMLQPFSDDLTTFDWTKAINEALKRLWAPTEFTITPTALATRHSLATTTWFTSPTQLLDVGYLTTGEVRANQDPYDHRGVYGEIEQDAGVLYLKTQDRSWSTNETIYVRAARRHYDLCRASGGAYGDQSGLSLETDEAPAPLEVVCWGACIEMARTLRNELTDAGKDHIQAHQAEWARLWTNAQRKLLGRLPTTRIHRAMAFFDSYAGARY